MPKHPDAIDTLIAEVRAAVESIGDDQSDYPKVEAFNCIADALAAFDTTAEEESK